MILDNLDDLSDNFYNVFVYAFILGTIIGLVCIETEIITSIGMTILFSLFFMAVFFFSMFEEDDDWMDVIVFGITTIITSGLIIILSHLKEVYPFMQGFYPMLYFILGIFVLIEIIFWVDKSKPAKGDNKFMFALKMKAQALGIILALFSVVSQVYVVLKAIDWSKYIPLILKWIGIIGVGIICLAIIIGIGYGWIKLNELKYRKKK